MTFLNLLVRPEGVFLSTDYQVSGGRRDDRTPKQLCIMCPPPGLGPRMLLGFVCLADAPGGTPMMQWVRETLRGEQRGIVETIQHLCDRLNRDIQPLCDRNNRAADRAGRSRTGLMLVGGILGGPNSPQERHIVTISNDRGSESQFSVTLDPVRTAKVALAGSGMVHVTAEDRALETGQAVLHPNHWEDHLGLLAAINRRVAVRDEHKAVSAWCRVSALMENRTDVFGKDFREPGEPVFTSGTGLIVGGFDFGVITEAMFAPPVDGEGKVQPVDLLDVTRRAVQPRL